MQRGEALARLRVLRWTLPNEKEAIEWALARIAALESIPSQIDGLVNCAEASDASQRTTLLLKLAAAEQRAAELVYRKQSELDEAREEVARLTAERDPLQADRERLTDLCRVARHHLHDEKLIDDREFAALVADSESGQRRARIEGYMREENEGIRAMVGSMSPNDLMMIRVAARQWAEAHRDNVNARHVFEALDRGEVTDA